MARTGTALSLALLALTLTSLGCDENTASEASTAAPPTRPAARTIPVTTSKPDAAMAFETGRDFADNLRGPEAIEQFRRAVELDPDFALAHAYLGSWLPGDEGLAELDRAVALAGPLPPAEAALIEAMNAGRRGDEAHERQLLDRVAQLAPDDWRAHYELGNLLFAWYHLDEAAEQFKRAGDLNGKVGSTFNMLGYVDLTRGQPEGAIAAFTRYLALSPAEPNPLDSLAEAQLAAGRFEEAEASFNKALAVAPEFHWSWLGIAQSRGLRGDWVGCREAIGKARAAAVLPEDQVETDFALAWAWHAQGDPTEALQTLDTLEKTALQQELYRAYAWVPVDRARIQLDIGQPEAALASLDEAGSRALAVGLPGGSMNFLRRVSLATQIQAQAELGRVDDARATLAFVEVELAKAQDNREVQSLAAFARGEVALASGSPAEAAHDFAQCLTVDFRCHYQEAGARAAMGDAAGSAAALAATGSTRWRDHTFLWTWAQVHQQQSLVSAVAR